MANTYAYVDTHWLFIVMTITIQSCEFIIEATQNKVINWVDNVVEEMLPIKIEGPISCHGP